MTAQKRSTISTTGKVSTLLAGLVLGTLLIALLESRGSGNHPGPATPSLSQSGLDYAVFVVQDDIESGLVGKDSIVGSITDADLMEWARLEGRTTAREYEASYDANEISADNQFKGKKLLLSGIIATVEKDFTGQGFLTLRGSEPFLGVHAQLNDHSMAEAATFRKGQKVNLVCEGAGRMATFAILDHCQPLNDYMEETAPSIKSRVTQFLSGKAALKRPLAEAVVYMYVVAQTMPASSQCLAGAKDTCESEMKAALQDPAAVISVKERVRVLIASLKVSPQ